MGEVYRARDTRLDRIVAIKILSRDLSASPEAQRRFEREAKALSEVSHPHICAVYDVGVEGETHYVVMEYLEGDTLASRLTKGALPLSETLRIGGQVAEALATIHRRGIVHRDVKPSNVMLTKSGAKLLDFGLARVMSAPAASSSTDTLTTPSMWRPAPSRRSVCPGRCSAPGSRSSTSATPTTSRRTGNGSSSTRSRATSGLLRSRWCRIG
jgi:serine/threonine protein kinase